MWCAVTGRLYLNMANVSLPVKNLEYLVPYILHMGTALHLNSEMAHI